MIWVCGDGGGEQQLGWEIDRSSMETPAEAKESGDREQRFDDGKVKRNGTENDALQRCRQFGSTTASMLNEARRWPGQRRAGLD